ncbi:hypothetical protein AMJ39_01760 [candidate division TA06 bacterium DG_24]|uniref:Single-stranded-DNA-specific exonuclease RecJ n=2 Tax=Bacteria division TA06 TaxID=1156500 RepID=A0A0S8GH63_UNCT6|nr:MAG: hypothetical protein AMJ39_01760 [candidate division TA06 bacterium DG_24]KPK71595.1 MAG: hypothetical protein AMJ82_00490 [candidate division TA06 bacterium SM23_40]
MRDEERVWKVSQIDEEAGERLCRALGMPLLLARLLVARGISSPDGARRYLSPALADFLDPYLLADMERAVRRINRAISSGERVTVVGHEDTDGLTGTVVLLEILRKMGAEADYYLPSRVEEGHGLSRRAIARAKQRGSALIVTVDCGVTDSHPVAEAGRNGIDVIVLDHHEVIAPLPSAVAVVDPKRPDSAYPFRGLAGVGVAFKTAQALVAGADRGPRAEWEQVAPDLLELVLLGSIADRVPLCDENRVAAVLGLKAFEATERIGLQALKHGLKGEEDRDLRAMELVQGSISLIASARSEDGGNDGCELLLTHDSASAGTVVTKLRKESERWHAAARASFDRVLKMLDREIDEPIIILVNEEIPYYLLGHCASRLRKLYMRPAILIGKRGAGLAGEARGPKWFDLMECLATSDELLESWGGHKGAAGFSLSRDRLPAFSDRVRAYAAERIDPVDLQEILRIDIEVGEGELGPDLIKVLAALRPYGEGNPAPLLLARTVDVTSQGPRCVVKAGGDSISLIDERRRSSWTDLSGRPLQLDIVFTLGDSDELLLVDCRPTFLNE